MRKKPLALKQMMPVSERLGEVLRQHREQMGLKLEAVAQKASISVLALHKLETGKCSSKSDTYERVAHALGKNFALVTMEAFLRGQTRK